MPHGKPTPGTTLYLTSVQKKVAQAMRPRRSVGGLLSFTADLDSDHLLWSQLLVYLIPAQRSLCNHVHATSEDRIPVAQAQSRFFPQHGL